jgi:hypothetical protein
VLNQLNPYFPLLACLGTWLIVAVGILYTRCPIADLSSHITEVMDLIKAEARLTEANIGRLEEKIDKIENQLSARIRRLESR